MATDQAPRQPTTPETWCQEGERLLAGGASLAASDTLSEAVKAFPHHVRLRQLLALSLARAGASRSAGAILQPLVDEGHADEETLGLLARTHKDLWTETSDSAERRRHLESARHAYAEAHRLSGGYWSGINAATMALLLDERSEASALARRVEARCRALRDADPARPDLYYVLATLGEAALLEGEWAKAEDCYRQAAQVGRERFGDLASTRRNARLILTHLDRDPGFLRTCLPVPPIVVCSGHLIDRPGRTPARFPPELEPAVRQAIVEYLGKHEPALGYASAGCGTDILFLEALGEMRVPTHVVLPYNREQFGEDSVDFVSGGRWRERYERVLADAAEVIVASEQRMADGGASFEYGLRMLDGVAALRADELDTELRCLAVWDGRASDGPGGTEASVMHWRRLGRAVDIIDVARLLRDHSSASVAAPASVAIPASQAPVPEAQASPAPASFEPQIVGLLFADAQGFSTLSEASLPRFVEHFLGAVAAEIHRLPSPPLLRNTWGDGLYLVFGSVRDAGVFALRLSEVIRTTDWRAKGFEHPLRLRTGLHAGPAYACLDPVTGRTNYIGTNVSRAARIEPITPPGEVYASQAFAALARADGIRDFTCAYVGQTPLAKGYGTYPTFVVRPRSQSTGNSG